jgi:pimeloyl-ACP methyl ester carboxylesterase
MKHILTLVFFLFFGCGAHATAEIWETQVEQTLPQEGDFSEYRLWTAPNAHPDKILVVVWGGNQCSLGIANDLVWQEFAASIKCALLTCFFCPQIPENHWDRADEGSGEALVKAIQNLASDAGESQLSTARLYLVGDSQGGQFAFSFASWQPARTLGFVSVKGGHLDADAIPRAARIPGLLFEGEADAPFRIANIEGTFSKGRAFGARWCLAIDPHGKHDPRPCGPLISSFLNALSKEHSAYDEQLSSSSKEMRDSVSGAVRQPRSWFPDTTFKRDWEAFEAGKLASSQSPLNFTSIMPIPKGIATSLSQDFGAIESGSQSRELSLDVTANGIADWDNVTTAECSYLSDTSVLTIFPGHFSIHTHLSTANLPIGRFTGVIPLRFTLQGKPTLGGVNIPVVATITGDVTATPSFIFLDTSKSLENQVFHIRITSKNRHAITLLSYQALPQIKVQTFSETVDFIDLAISFNNESKPVSTSGSIMFHLKTDKGWILRIPYIDGLREQ